MSFGDMEMIFGNELGRLIVLLLLALICVMAFFCRRTYESWPKGLWLVPMLVRAMAVILLAIMLLQPRLQRTYKTTEKGSVLVLVDGSSSMSVCDMPDQSARFDSARRILTRSKRRFLEDLGAKSRVQLYRFSEDLERAVEDRPSNLGEPDGLSTSLGRCVGRAASLVRGEPFAGIVLLSDGRDLGATPPAEVAQAVGAPIYVVGLGGKKEKAGLKDVAVTQVVAEDTVLVDSTLLVEVTVENEGCHGTATVSIRADEEEITSALVTLRKETRTQTVQLKFAPHETGRFIYTVTVSEQPDEANIQNNERSFVVEVVGRKINVLYIEGMMRFDYKFLRRALEGEKDVALTSYLRISETKFYRQGRKWRGLGGAAPDAPQDGLPLRKGQIEDYNVIILGDLPANCFAPEQLALVAEHVSEGAAAFVMLGGKSSYGMGGYQDTPLAKVLPVTMKGAADGHEARHFKAVPSPESLSHPVLRLSADLDENRLVWQNLPALTGCNKITALKPGASRLLIARPRRGVDEPVIVLAVQRYGKGKSAALTADTTWRWRLEALRGGASGEFHTRFWSQLIHWLLPERPDDPEAQRPIIISTDKPEYTVGESVLLEARVINKDGLPGNDATVQGTLRLPDEKELDVTLQFVPGSAGIYRTAFQPRVAGRYEVSATASVKGAALGHDTTRFLVGATSLEMENTDINEEFLKELAEASKGAYYTPGEAGRIPSDVKAVRQERVKTTETRLWNHPLMLVIFVCIASVEWVVRRWTGAP